MPKIIITKSTTGLFNYAKKTGHIKPKIINVVNDVIDYTSLTIINKLSYNTNENNSIREDNFPKLIIEQINSSSKLLQKNVELIKNLPQVNQVPTIPENEIKNLYYDFIYPYITIGPYNIPHFLEFQRLIELIDNQLIGTTIENDYKLKLYKGLLNVLLNGKKSYYSELQFESENKMLRNKICNLEELVKKYSKELALCKGLNSDYYIPGKLAINLFKPKNLIYSQALLNIYIAWYMYLFNTSTIEFDKFKGVIDFVKEKGDSAYDELIKILDEKYKDIEDELYNNNSSSNSSLCNLSDSNSDTYSSCTSLPNDNKYCSNYSLCELSDSNSDTYSSCTSLTNDNNFSSNNDIILNSSLNCFNGQILSGNLSINLHKFKSDLINCFYNKPKTKRKNKNNNNRSKKNSYIK